MANYMSYFDFNTSIEKLTSHYLDCGGNSDLCMKALRGLADNIEYALKQNMLVEPQDNIWMIPDMDTEEIDSALLDII